MELRVNRKISTQKSGTHYSPTVGIHAKENRKTEISETKSHNCFHILKLLLSLKKNIKWLQNLR